MGIVRDIITPILPVVLGIAIGAGGSQMWGWYRYTSAINAERELRGERDQLVTQLADARNALDKAQAVGKQQRQAVYGSDPNAKAWSSRSVPDVLAKRVHDAARAAQSASRGASDGMSNDAKGAHAKR